MADNRNLFTKIYDQLKIGDNKTFKSAGTLPKPTGKIPSYQPSTAGSTIDDSPYRRALEESLAREKSYTAQLAAQPKLPMYDSGQAWARAQQQAESVVNPVYVDKLNRKIQEYQLKRQQTEQQTNINKELIGTSLS